MSSAATETIWPTGHPGWAVLGRSRPRRTRWISLSDELFPGGTGCADAGSDLTKGRDAGFQLMAGFSTNPANRQERSGIPALKPNARHGSLHAIVARWLIHFPGMMLTLDKTLIAMCPPQPYS